MPDPSHLPLVELALTEAQEIPSSAANSTHNITEGGAVQENKETQKKKQTAESKVSKDGSKRRSLIESYIEQMYITNCHSDVRRQTILYCS